MKKVIRWLADMSGVTTEIKIESYKQAGSSMRQNAYWWNGGIMHKQAKPEVWNAFFLYSDWLIRGFRGPMGGGMMDLRSKVYDIGNDMLDPDNFSSMLVRHDQTNENITPLKAF